MRSLLVATLVAASALLALPPDASAAATVPVAAAPAPTSTTAAPPPSDVDLSGDHRGAVGADHDRPAGRLRAAVAWPRGTIRYHETIPAKWQWGLDRAIAHWNGSGAKVRFVKVTSRRRAQAMALASYSCA